MHQSVDAAQVHEGTEVDDGGDNARTDLTLFELVEERGANLRLGLLEPGTAGEDHVVAVLVQLDDLGFDFLADVRSQIAHAAHFDQRCRQEAAQTDVQDEPTLDHLDDGTGDDAVLFLDLFDVAPGALVLCALLGQDQTAFLVLLGEDEGLDVVTDGDNVARINIVLDGKFAGRNDTLGLITDVEQDFVAVDLDDGALNEVSIVEVLDGGVDSCEEVFSGTDVVDRDLRGTGLLVGGDGHVVGAPMWIETSVGKPEVPAYSEGGTDIIARQGMKHPGSRLISLVPCTRAVKTSGASLPAPILPLLRGQKRAREPT